MNTRIFKGLAAVMLAGFVASAAWAHGGGRGHVRSGVYLSRPAVSVGFPVYRSHYYAPAPALVYGVPLGAAYYGGYRGYYGVPGYYGGPAYYGPPVVSAPPVYVEQAVPAPQSYWYWCAEPQGYYPDVRECAGGWQAVAPQPAVPQQ